MYTSGSTGEPKGIAVPHRAIVRLVVNAGYLRLEPGDTLTHASHISFDAATFEIWGALLNGARLLGVPRATLLSAPALAEFLEENRVDTCFLTTALFHQIALQAPATFRSLRDLLVGGEALDPQAARSVLGDSIDPAPRLFNAYGPTESTTFATVERVERPDPDAAGVPIGRPIGNTECHVVDPRGEPVPIGVAGELWIGGDGLARGYFGRPGLTAERFVPDPFGPPGSRLYRTGDLARRRSDGRIEFLGRIDQQVKLRGFRIEPGEVEAAVAAHPGVRQAVALVREDAPGDRRLVAYVVPEPGAVLSPKELRETARRRLAEFMVPAAFVELAALPLNPNGKVDREALPRPDGLAGDGETPFVVPRNHLERLIAGVWQEVLGMSEVGVHHNFFDLGGQSLLMIKVQDRLQEALGRAVPVTDLFEHTTVSALARHLEQQGGPPREPEAAPAAVSERAARQRQALTRQPARPRTAL
jgi:acyl-coenzyme A synthetase/AMP-(fatty) acid ligase